MYQVIARKYRPQLFGDVVGQEHVKTTLRNAIAQNRIAHGYIFSGQRGTGKTTMARILARCLNCVNGPTEMPCGICASCTEIAAGSAVDVIEIDAASNRGINEMRELRENVRYQPARDRRKIFIIDEAHQITSDAFNALLKTIEEPPSWAVFILCTTEAHKIPATIASRCQHFSFRSVDFGELVERMRWICTQEGIEAGDEALAVLAQAGEGSVRDSLSALDQAIACSGARLEAADVRMLLGSFSLDVMGQVAQALIDEDSTRMLDIVDDLERNGQNLQHFSRELARYFRNLLVARIAGESSRLIAASAREISEMARVAGCLSEADLTRYLQLSLDLFRGLQVSLQPRFHLEVGLLRLVQAGKLVSIEQAIADLKAGGALASATTPLIGRTAAAPQPQAIAITPPRRGPSPFEMDRAKKAGSREPQSSATSSLGPMSAGANALAPAVKQEVDWHAQILCGLNDLGLNYTADAMTHAEVAIVGNDLQIRIPAEYKLVMHIDELQKAVVFQKLGPINIKMCFVEATALKSVPHLQTPTDVMVRALAHPEVARFQQLFGGEIRVVRNLKE